jgi:membrane protease YdiL (CAAX protease family)
MTNPFTWIWRIWQELDDERERNAPLDWRPLVVLIFAAVSLTLQEYLGDRGVFENLVTTHGWKLGKYADLASFAWWSGWRVLGYLILPMIVVLCMPGERLRDYGWSPRGFFRHFHLYVAMYLIVLPLVVIMSHTVAFKHIYPFYRLSNRSQFDFLAWEAMYAAQFLSLEFFFRGFLLQGLKRACGVHAIWVMAVPYCMIHYGKTFAETMAAIVAGVTLGTVAMRTRSIWGGVAIHIGVAITMDLLTVRALP